MKCGDGKMKNEDEELARAKARLQAIIEKVFVETEPDTESRLRLVSMIAKHPDSESIEAFQIILTRIATSPTEKEVTEDIDEDARKALRILNGSRSLNLKLRA